MVEKNYDNYNENYNKDDDYSKAAQKNIAKPAIIRT